MGIFQAIKPALPAMPAFFSKLSHMPGDAGHGTGQFSAYRQVLTLAGPQKSAVGQVAQSSGHFPLWMHDVIWAGTSTSLMKTSSYW